MLLLSQHLVNHRYQASELLFVIEAGELDDATLSVDEYVAGDSRFLQCVSHIDTRVRIEAQWIGDTYLRGKGLNGRERLVTVNAHEHEVSVVLVLLPDIALDERHLAAADRAPAGGELQHDYLATQLRKVYGTTIGQRDRKVRSHLADTHQITGLISIGQLVNRIDLRLTLARERLEDLHFDRRESAVCIHLLAAELIVGAGYYLRADQHWLELRIVLDR